MPQHEAEVRRLHLVRYDRRKLVFSVTGKATWMCGDR